MHGNVQEKWEKPYNFAQLLCPFNPLSLKLPRTLHATAVGFEIAVLDADEKTR